MKKITDVLIDVRNAFIIVGGDVVKFFKDHNLNERKLEEIYSYQHQKLYDLIDLYNELKKQCTDLDYNIDLDIAYVHAQYKLCEQLTILSDKDDIDYLYEKVSGYLTQVPVPNKKSKNKLG